MTYDNTVLKAFICEVCGKTEALTDEQAFGAGWDYPPFIGMQGVISPRTCGNCPMDETAWWWIAVENKGKPDWKKLPVHHYETVNRILDEKNHAH